MNADELLQQVLQGLKAMCNHCQINDCAECWANEMCEQIIKYFNSPPTLARFSKRRKTPSRRHLERTPKF